MRVNQIIGIVLLVAGGLMLYFGYTASQGIGQQIHETFTGRFTEALTWQFVVGTLAAAAGVALLVLGRRT